MVRIYRAFGGSGCGLSMTLEAFELAFGGSGCGFSMTLEPFEAAFGGNGCGLSITLDRGLFTLTAVSLNFGRDSEPGWVFFPETMMIDLCEALDCAAISWVAPARLTPPACSEENC
jgi:hypothetical protein